MGIEQEVFWRKRPREFLDSAFLLGQGLLSR
jgi:hypothetical protein